MVTFKEREKAPAFTGKDANGKKIPIKNFQGKKMEIN